MVRLYTQFFLVDLSQGGVCNPDLENIVTPIDATKLGDLLRAADYNPDETAFLVDGFRHGFDLHYHGPLDRCSKARNIPFSVGNHQVMWDKLMKEVSLGRVAGPFDQVPFENFIQSPIGLVPKDRGTQTHLIFHLSYEFADGLGSVNSHIPKEFCSVQYPDLDTAVHLCLQLKELGAEQVYFSKTDGKSAFRVLPLRKSSWCWLVMSAVNPDTGRVQYFVDKLAHLLQWRVHCRTCLTNYLDDFLFLARLLAQCNWYLVQFIQLCSEVGFPLSEGKTVWGCLQIVFLGILMNGFSFSLSIPLDKRDKAIFWLEQFLHRKKAKVKELQELCGFLNFLNKAIFPGHAFTHRMYAKYAVMLDGCDKDDKVTRLKRYHHVRLDGEFKLDCQVWLEFLRPASEAVVSRPMVDLSQKPVHSVDIKFSLMLQPVRFWVLEVCLNLTGCGEVGLMISSGTVSQVLSILSFLHSLLGCSPGGDQLRNLRILINCDNQAVVAMVNNTTSKCKNCMFLI